MRTVGAVFRSLARILATFLLIPAVRAQYVGSKACQPCHSDKVEIQSKTAHAHALSRAPDGSPGYWAFGAGAKATTYVSQVDPETYEVRADGELLVCEPAAELPMTQRYFLF